MPTPDRDRDAGTGQFVSDAYADANPGTTTSEPVEPHPTKAQTAQAGNLALFLTEQLGVQFYPVQDGRDVAVAMSLDTANAIYQSGRKFAE